MPDRLLRLALRVTVRVREDRRVLRVAEPQERHRAGTAALWSAYDAIRAETLLLRGAEVAGAALESGAVTGALEVAPGAAGDVVVWSGDPLEPLSQPSAIFVGGVEQPLESRPLLLRDRYRQQTPMPPAYRN